MARDEASDDDPVYNAWFDQVWSADWTPYVDDFTVADDLASIENFEAQILDVVENAASASAIASGMSTLMANANFTNPQLAALVTEAAGLAVSSAEYWELNFDAWLEQMCEDDPPQDARLGATPNARVDDEFCDGGGGLLRATRARVDLSLAQKAIIAADVGGSLGIVKDVIDGVRSGWNLWQDGAYLLEGKSNMSVKNIVRAIRPSSAALVRASASALVRSNLLANLAIGAIGSGLAWWAVQ
jgi:hypothetical protein